MGELYAWGLFSVLFVCLVILKVRIDDLERRVENLTRLSCEDADELGKLRELVTPSVR